MAEIALPVIRLTPGNWNNRPIGGREMSVAYSLYNKDDQIIDIMTFEIYGDRAYVNDCYDRCWEATRADARAVVRDLKNCGYKETAYWTPTFV